MDGQTTPFFKAVGNVPDDSDALISSVMSLVRASADCFTTWVGMGSSTQDLVLERRMMSLIEASDIVIIIITLLTCQVCLAEGKPSTNRDT